MAQIDDLIATYLNAVETEGKSVRTIKSYRDSLASFRLVGRRLGFPDAVGDHDVTHVYAFLAELRARRGRSGRATTTPIYQNHHHRTLGAFFSWCRRMGYLDAERTHVFAGCRWRGSSARRRGLSAKRRSSGCSLAVTARA